MNRKLTKLSKGALLATAAVVMSAASTAHAQTATPTAADTTASGTPVPDSTAVGSAATTEAAGPVTTTESDAAGEIIVLGTRRTDRSVTDSASPIDVIGTTELNAQPAANMLDIVRNLVPSFFVPQNTISDASTFVRSPSLRGLGADQILVMINGKRYNRSALVTVYTGADTALSFGSQGADIANIPAIAIKNLQILRDGATAQYGSDAIGGVINYQIRDDEGIELQGLYGETYEGDGARRMIAGNAGLKVGSRGFINFSAEYFKDGGTSRGVTRPQAAVLATTNPSIANRIPNFPDLPAQIWGSSPADGYKVFVNAAVDVGDTSQFYFTGNLANSKANQSFNYRPPNTVAGLVIDTGTGAPSTTTRTPNGSFNTIFLTPCPAVNPTCPAGGFVNDTNTFSFTSIYPGGFTPRFIGKVDQRYGTLGFKGKTDTGFTYDISGTVARNSLDLSMTDSLSPSYGPLSQTSFDFGKLIQKEMNLNLDMTYPIEAGFHSPITLSGGAEYRRETYSKTVGDLQSYGSGPYAGQPLYNQTAPGVFAPVPNTAAACPRFNSDLPATAICTATQSPAASGYGGVSPTFAGSASQTSYGVYVGAETDITAALTVGAAARYEHYNTFGSAYVGKLNALFRITDQVSIRGTVGNGFHAPSPGQNNTQIVTTNFRSGNQVQTGTYPVTSSIAQFYGADVLKPEKSTNLGAGIVFKPFSGASLTIDGYSIKVKNRIGISQNFTVTQADLTTLPDLAVVGVAGDVNYFTNGFDTITRGIDVVGNYRTRLIDGPLNLTLAYNYNKSKVTSFDPSVISDDQRFNIKNIAPKHRATLSANWQVGDFSVNVRENYYSSWANRLEYPGQRFGSKFTTDLDVSYTFMDRYTLTVGGSNIFDTYPDKIAPSVDNPIYALTGGLNDGQIYPRSGGPFGINGGFWYARVRVKI